MLSKFPFSILYPVSSVLSFFIFRVFRYRTKVIRRQIATSFPEKSEAWHQATASKFYRNFTDIWIETIKALTISKEELNQRVSFKDYHVLGDYLNNQQSCIALSSHIGNWEWVLLRCSAQEGFETDAAYQKIESPFFSRLMLSIRSRFGAVLIERQQLLRALIQRRNLTRAIAIIADQGPTKRVEMKHWWSFLNQPTSFYTAAAKMAISQNLPMLYSGMYRTSRGYYTVYFKLLAAPPYHNTDEVALTHLYKNSIEENIRMQPEAYLWSHRRWKRKIADFNKIITD